jgi:1-acyl-sn-glycerol-3-phosphate acyltransferase
MDKLFYKLCEHIAAHKLFSLSIALILFSSLGYLASRLEFEEDITKLIPQNEKSSEAQKVFKHVNFADKIIVNIQREKEGSVDDLITYAQIFIDSISESSEHFIKQIQGKVADEDVLNTLDFVYNNLPLFLNEKDYKQIAGKLNKDSIYAITNNNYKALISPTGFVTKDIILKDPLGLSFIALKKLQELNVGDNFTLYNNFILSKDQNHVLLFITPTYASSETDRNTQFSNELYALQEHFNEVFKDKASSTYFGGALVAVANANQIKKDIQLTIGIATAILLIILILFYRRFSTAIILFIPTALGALLAMAVLFIIRTKISAISLGIGSVLVGVTIDYALHILTHIKSNNNIEALYKDITKPILMSSITTALAFLCLLFLESQALQDLGLFAAISVLSASVFALIFIPQAYNIRETAVTKKTVIDAVASYPFHKKKWALIVMLLALGISTLTFNQVSFNNDLNTLNYESPALAEAQKGLDTLTNISSKSIYLAAYGNSDQEALKVNDAILTKLKHLKENNKVINFSSIGSLINSDSIQSNKIEAWERFWSPENKQNIQAHLIESGSALGFKPSTFSPFYSHINTSFKTLSIEDYSPLKAISSEDFITSTEGFSTIATLVQIQDAELTHVIDTFKDSKQIVIIDRKEMNETFLGGLKNDFNRLVLYSSFVVYTLLFFFYRSLSLTLVTGIPIALTWLLTIGMMGLFNIEFNIFNIIISTFIFGLGIDYCIFITNALLHEYRTGERSLATHKTSIILSVITTLLGVGVLVFAKHPALHSIALVSIVGILSALTIAFTLQPLLFNLFIGNKTKTPITLRLLIHSIFSFGYYGVGGFILSVVSVVILPIIPISKKVKMVWFHKTLSKFMKSVLYTNPFVDKRVLNPHNETFEKQAILIANHTSFLDILAMGMLSPKIIFIVNDWVYNSPIFGRAVRMAGFYPASNGIENGVSHLQEKISQGYSLMIFPEGTRSLTNKIKRFHKGAFYLSVQFNLDILPVLIHGNSEVNPKGSFIIKDGSITVKILNRITPNDTSFGENYTQRTKQIGAYFKKEFDSLRQEIEPANYFHDLIIENYRYKGNEIYKYVKKDLKIHENTYKTITDLIGKNDTVIHLSKDPGHLNLLLALNSNNRKILTYLNKNEHAQILENCYTTHRYQNIKIAKTIDEALHHNANVIIVNLVDLSAKHLETIFNNPYSLFIFINESRNLLLNRNIPSLETIIKNDIISILKPIS